MIIQITTIGNHDMVNKIVSSIRSYKLVIPYELWVVTESSQLTEYEDAERILDVGHDFKSISQYKGRALDYSSQVRKSLGIIDKEIKILYLDDDSIPSKAYIEKCFIGDYDIMEGIIQPKLSYGTHYSYVENIRTLACTSVCSVFQSHGHPVWVHGEGMCVRASTEQKIGWQYDAIASEDLIFGHSCATNKMKWGFVWEPIYITSPWSLDDYFRQRKRWLWGNINAIANILTWKSKARMITFYVVGSVTLIISTTGFIMDHTHIFGFREDERILLYLSMACWFGIYGYIGRTIGDGKLRHIFLSMALAWYSSFMNTFPIWMGLFFRRPERFDVINKEKKKTVVKSKIATSLP